MYHRLKRDPARVRKTGERLWPANLATASVASRTVFASFMLFSFVGVMSYTSCKSEKGVAS